MNFLTAKNVYLGVSGLSKDEGGRCQLFIHKNSLIVPNCALFYCIRQCCVAGSGSSSEFSEFRILIQAKFPDPCGSGSTTLVSGVHRDIFGSKILIILSLHVIKLYLNFWQTTASLCMYNIYVHVKSM